MVGAMSFDEVVRLVRKVGSDSLYGYNCVVSDEDNTRIYVYDSVTDSRFTIESDKKLTDEEVLFYKVCNRLVS